MCENFKCESEYLGICIYTDKECENQECDSWSNCLECDGRAYCYEFKGYKETGHE